MVEADPALLSLHPEMNMLLDDGDHLHIPKRTLSVRVSGEVMNPASLLFNDNFDPQDYIRQAGGTTYYADRKRSFVVYPDGSAHPIGRSSWNNSSQAMIIPGSTIIVPRDPKPFDFMDSFKDITQILSNMAITGVFIEDIATDEN
jgi:protein involved in polysaccharide export with SLBB domain